MADVNASGSIRVVYRRTTVGGFNNRSTDLMFMVVDSNGTRSPATGYFAVDLAGSNATDSLERLVLLAAEHSWNVRLTATPRPNSNMVDVYDLAVDT